MSQGQANHRLPAWISIFVGLAALLGLLMLRQGPASPFVMLSTPQGFEARLLADPSKGALIAAMKVGDPAEMGRFFEDGARHIRDGASAAQIARFSAGFMSAAGQRQRARLARAPRQVLNPLILQELWLLDQLRGSNPRQCAGFAATGDLDLAHLTPMAREMAVAFTKMRWKIAAEYRETVDGGARPTREDMHALTATMRRDGLSEADARIFESGEGEAHVPPESLCQITFHMYYAVMRLPPERIERVMHWMLGPA